MQHDNAWDWLYNLKYHVGRIVDIPDNKGLLLRDFFVRILIKLIYFKIDIYNKFVIKYIEHYTHNIPYLSVKLTQNLNFLQNFV